MSAIRLHLEENLQNKGNIKIMIQWLHLKNKMPFHREQKYFINRVQN